MQMDRSQYKQPSVETNILHISMESVFTNGNHNVSLFFNDWVLFQNVILFFCCCVDKKVQM